MPSIKILEYSNDPGCGCDDFYRFEKMQGFALTGREGRECRDEAEFIEKFQEHPVFFNWAETVKDIERAEFYNALNEALEVIGNAIIIDLQQGHHIGITEVTADKIMQHLHDGHGFNLQVTLEDERLVLEKNGHEKRRLAILPGQLT